MSVLEAIEVGAPPRTPLPVHPREWLAMLWRRRLVVVVTAALVLGAAWARGFERAPVYRSTPVHLEIVSDGARIATISDVFHRQSVTSVALNTQVELIRSRRVLHAVHSEIAGLADRLPYARFVEAVHVESIRGTLLVRIWVESPIAHGNAEAANAIADKYADVIQSHAEQRHGRIAGELERREDAAREALAAVDAELAAWRETNAIADPASEREKLELVVGRLEVRCVESDISAVRFQRAADQISTAEAPHDSPEVVSDAGYSAVTELIARLAQERIALLREFRETRPDVQVVDDQLAFLERRRSALVPLIVARVEDAARDANEESRRLVELRDAKRDELRKVADLEVELANMEERRAGRRSDVGELVAQREKLQGALGFGLTPVVIWERAREEAIPHGGDRQGNIGVAAVLAAILAALAALACDRWSDVLRTRADAERETALPVLGSVPHVRGRRRRRDRLVVDRPESAAAESVRFLRLSIEHAMASQGTGRRLLVTSPRDGDGRTSTAVHLAAALAADGADVRLVDADLRAPRLHDIFGLDRSPGLAEACESEDPAHAPSPEGWPEGLAVLTAGAASARPADGLVADRATAILGERERGWTIVDAAAACTTSHAAAIARHVDSVLMVVRSGRTTTRDLGEALERFAAIGVPVLGIVVTDVRG